MTQSTTADTTGEQNGFQTLADKLNADDATRIDGGDQPRELPMDDVLRVLQNERRRVLLDALVEEDTPARKADLADAVADATGDADDTDFRKTVYVTLHQNHLPTLEQFDVVRQVDEGVYELGPTADQVLAVKNRIDQQDAVTNAVGDALGRIASRFR